MDKDFLDIFMINKNKWKVTLKSFNKNDVMVLDERGIGQRSSFGRVYAARSNDSQNKYVVKLIRFISNDGFFQPYREKIFRNEIEVGSHQALFTKKAGPRVLAYYINVETGFGAYVMDNFLLGRPDYKAFSLQSYNENVIGGCPHHTHDVIIKLRNSLINFYNITKGYHGDLHTDNIAVVTNKTGKIMWVYIFDYGSHVRFMNKKFKCASLMDAFDEIHDNFSKAERNQNKKGRPQTYYPASSNVLLLNGNGQNFRSNVQMLKHNKLFDPLIRNFMNKRHQNKLSLTGSSKGSSSLFRQQ